MGPLSVIQIHVYIPVGEADVSVRAEKNGGGKCRQVRSAGECEARAGAGFISASAMSPPRLVRSLTSGAAGCR